jgi:hypothetical protein
MWQREYDVELVLDRLGIDYRLGNDGQANGLCPFHDEHRASWGISLDSGLWLCRACGEKGNLVQLASRIRGTSPYRAQAWMRSSMTGVMCAPAKPATIPEVRVSARNFRRFWSADRPSDDLLESRRIDRATGSEYHLRADSDTWLIPVTSSVDETVMLGWQRKGPEGHPVNIPAGMHFGSALFGYHQARGHWPRILVESPLDVATLASAGIRGAVASFGTCVSGEQAQALLALADSLNPVLLALDNDDAGRKATARLVKEHPGMFAVFDYRDCPAKDPGDMTAGEIGKLFAVHLT